MEGIDFGGNGTLKPTNNRIEHWLGVSQGNKIHVYVRHYVGQSLSRGAQSECQNVWSPNVHPSASAAFDIL